MNEEGVRRPSSGRPMPVGGADVVPHLPPVPEELLADHERAHEQLAAAIGEAGGRDPAAVAVFTHLARRIVIESLAHLHPVLADPSSPLLVPPPRSNLTPLLLRRRHGAAEAFRHVDVRVAMVRHGHVAHPLERSTPEVLNALLQSGPGTGIADDVETNPGLVRATPTNWKPEANPFEHPPPERCRPLLESAVDLVAHAPSPAVVRAGWLAFTINTIHPFVDGNGRTARACALAVAASGAPTAMEWGVLEQWNLAREGYVDALRAGQRARAYAAEEVDATPFVSHTVRSSAAGARLCVARLQVVSSLVDELRRAGLDTASTVAAGAVLVDRSLPLAAIGRLVAPFVGEGAPDAAVADGDEVAGGEVAIRLAGNGVLAWIDTPAGSDPGAPRRSLAAGPALAALAAPYVAARGGADGR